MTEYGIFNDEGCVEAQFYSREEAEAAIADRYTDETDDDLEIHEVCPDHEEQRRDVCEECFTEESDDNDEESE